MPLERRNLATYLDLCQVPITGLTPVNAALPRRRTGSMLLSLEDMVMDNFDLSPLFRSTIGFDRLMQFADAATRIDASYPPYNIEITGENAYRLSMAVAGFAPEDLDITVKENALLVSGKAKKDEESKQYLHRGIARRAFERHF